MSSDIQIGQHWRDDLDGCLTFKVVGFDSRGWPIVRHVNAKSGGRPVNPVWFKHWERTR